jgi:hypothetical protein
MREMTLSMIDRAAYLGGRVKRWEQTRADAIRELTESWRLTEVGAADVIDNWETYAEQQS